MFKKLCLIGVGLIGSSVARAAKKHGMAESIVAYGRKEDLDNLQTAQSLKVIDHYYLDMRSALASADFVVIAVPVGAFESIFRLLQPHWRDDVLYSDVGSTKGSVIDAAHLVFGQIPGNFIPAHPIAGAENSGVEAGKEGLFDNKRLIITPLEDSNCFMLDKLTRFWEGIGASVSLMNVTHHDAVLAATSHFPHVLAFSLVNMLGREDEQAEIFKYAAGGFKDFSRIASSDPTMWLDICMANRENIVSLIQQLQNQLSEVKQMLEGEENQHLMETFKYANEARQRYLDQLEI